MNDIFAMPEPSGDSTTQLPLRHACSSLLLLLAFVDRQDSRVDLQAIPMWIGQLTPRPYCRSRFSYRQDTAPLELGN